MTDFSPLIGPIFQGASQLVSHVVQLATSGRQKEARELVARFVATTDRELADDKAKAVARLEERFPTKPSAAPGHLDVIPPPPTLPQDLYDDTDPPDDDTDPPEE